MPQLASGWWWVLAPWVEWRKVWLNPQQLTEVVKNGQQVRSAESTTTPDGIRL